MKALELASSIEMGLKYQIEFGRRVADLERDVPKAAAELRRLAALNAELVEALEAMLDEDDGGMMAVKAKQTLAKAKEQQ